MNIRVVLVHKLGSVNRVRASALGPRVRACVWISVIGRQPTGQNRFLPLRTGFSRGPIAYLSSSTLGLCVSNLLFNGTLILVSV